MGGPAVTQNTSFSHCGLLPTQDSGVPGRASRRRAGGCGGESSQAWRSRVTCTRLTSQEADGQSTFDSKRASPPIRHGSLCQTTDMDSSKGCFRTKLRLSPPRPHAHCHSWSSLPLLELPVEAELRLTCAEHPSGSVFKASLSGTCVEGDTGLPSWPPPTPPARLTGNPHN